jgi:5-methylcytosine-specific restriction endonuclease McrBC GTP-binding regulatory subunit McrB
VHSLPAETAPVKLDASAGDSEATEMPFDWTERFEVLLQEIEQSGFSYQPWQVATYLTALRTKPFVILAGVSGTGKSKLPAIVAKFTGMADTKRIAVRPDWTDSSEVLGYQDLNGRFRPGVILREFHAAAVDNSRFHTCIIDEMNLAPVENYFAEILSAMEDTNRSHDGLQWSSPLLPFSCHNTEMPWAATRIPPNIALVGTVNVDETTHQFSRKVLDRAFTIELAEIDLEMLPPRRSVNTPADMTPKSLWPISFWLATHRRLSDLDATVPETRAILDRVNNVLSQLNTALNRTQMQVGYRVRDEIAIFVYHSQLLFAGFRTHSGTIIDALDAALLMKILPRIVGSSHGIRRLLTDLLGIAQTGRLPNGELSAGWIGESAEQIVDAAGTDVLFPLFFARLMLMLRRLDSEGYTSFWI